MAKFHLDGLDFSLLLAHVLIYSRKMQLDLTTINRGEFHISTKTTVTFGIPSVILPLLKALLSPILWIYILLCGSENRFLKLWYEKYNAFTALGLKSMSTTRTQQKWLNKGVWIHLFSTSSTTYVLELWCMTNWTVCQHKADGRLEAPDGGQGEPEGTAQGITWFFPEPAARAAQTFFKEMVVSLGTYCLWTTHNVSPPLFISRKYDTCLVALSQIQTHVCASKD